MMLPKTRPVRDPEYLKWLAGCQCCVPGCNYSPCEAGHVGRTGKGIAVKASDHEALPICFRHHRKYHLRGHLWFAREYRVSFEKQITKYRRMYAMKGDA